MDSGGKVMQWARESAAIVLAWLFRNIPIVAPELLDIYHGD